MSTLKLENETIKKALLTMDEDILPQNVIKNLFELAPSSEEVINLIICHLIQKKIFLLDRIHSTVLKKK